LGEKAAAAQAIIDQGETFVEDKVILELKLMKDEISRLLHGQVD